MSDDINRRFNHHPPKDDSVVLRHEHVRDVCRKAAEMIDAAAPDGREKSLAITKLEEAMMWANAAIARGYSAPPADGG